MKKTLCTLAVVVALSACTTTTSTNPTQTPSVAEKNSNWTASLSAQKPALRSCIIADKNIQAILNIEQQPKTTTLVVQDKNATILNCVVDARSNKFIRIEPSDLTIATSPKFYPVGKKIPACHQKENIMDAEGRLMGVVCR